MLQACSRLMPAATASRVTQSMPNSMRSSASRSSVQTQMRLCDEAEFRDRLDRFRQRMPRRRGRAAAQEDPDARIEQIVGDVAVDRLMRVGDAARRIGRDELAAVDVARHRPAALQRRREDRVAALVAHGDGHEVHLLAERRGLRPAVEQRRDLLGRQVAAGRLEIAARWPAPVLGTVRKIESGAWRASSSIISMPAASITLPISWLSQKIVVVPLSSAASA